MAIKGKGAWYWIRLEPMDIVKQMLQLGSSGKGSVGLRQKSVCIHMIGLQVVEVIIALCKYDKLVNYKIDEFFFRRKESVAT